MNPLSLQDVLQIGKLPYVLAELKGILMSPIKTPKNQNNKADDLTGKPSFSEEDEDNIHQQELSNAQQQQQDENNTCDQDAFEDENNLPRDLTSTEQTEATTPEDDAENSIDPEEEDLPTEIVRVMGKACTQILVTQPDEECCLTYLGLLERVLTHEAFSQNDKRHMQSWKTQCQKLARQLAMNRKLGSIEKGPKKCVFFFLSNR